MSCPSAGSGPGGIKVACFKRERKSERIDYSEKEGINRRIHSFSVGCQEQLRIIDTKAIELYRKPAWGRVSCVTDV